MRDIEKYKVVVFFACELLDNPEEFIECVLHRLATNVNQLIVVKSVRFETVLISVLGFVMSYTK